MIIYFSGTGNSYTLAKKLAEVTNDRIMPLKKAFNDGSENIVFVFPTYVYNIPPNVREFIKNFDIHKNQTVSGISVSGGNNGNSEYTFNKIIEKKGHKVKKFRNVIMTDNSFPVLLNGKINSRQTDINIIINEFLNLTYENKSKFNPFYAMGEPLLFNKAGKHLLRKKVDTNKCVGCGICASICPNDNIKIIENKAVINNNCAQCFGCIHWCPNQSIYIKKGLKKESQYHNKDISYKELNK